MVSDVPAVDDASLTVSRKRGPNGFQLLEEMDMGDELPEFSDVEMAVVQGERPLAINSVCPDQAGPDSTITSALELERSAAQETIFNANRSRPFRLSVSFYLVPRLARLHRKDLQTILWLERSAQSSVRRWLGKVGAMAALRGEHSLFLIKKNKVVLGRQTDENHDVDFDLAMEGNAAKVSRHQAILRLSRSLPHSFKLINIGRRTVHVNCHEVATGEQRRLERHALIEVGGLRFIFEVNSNSLKYGTSNKRPFLVSTAIAPMDTK